MNEVKHVNVENDAYDEIDVSDNKGTKPAVFKGKSLRRLRRLNKKNRREFSSNARKLHLKFLFKKHGKKVVEIQE